MKLKHTSIFGGKFLILHFKLLLLNHYIATTNLGNAALFWGKSLADGGARKIQLQRGISGRCCHRNRLVVSSIAPHLTPTILVTTGFRYCLWICIAQQVIPGRFYKRWSTARMTQTTKSSGTSWIVSLEAAPMVTSMTSRMRY